MLKRIAENVLGELLFPPNEELLNTLRVYLLCGGNKKDTAQQLYIHVNTLNYRIAKLEKMLELDLRNPKATFCLELAVRVYDYLQVL